MTTTYPASSYPTALDAFSPDLVDNVDEVVANHQNTGYGAIRNIQTKLGITGGVGSGFGGLSFDSAGVAANPGVAGNPTIWPDNASASFALMYTDELGVDYNLLSAAAVGFGYTCPGGAAVGHLMYISAADTVNYADAVVGNSARGMIVNVYGGGTTCDILYVGEVVNGGWALTPGATYYLTTAGAFATAPPGSPVVVQEVGFARNSTTLVFRPTVEST